MSEHALVGFTTILALGIGARWLAWWLRVPAILLLLTCGLVAGPFAGALHPDELFGTLLLPIVSLSVAIVLFEGGLSLRLRDLPQIGRILRNLIGLGALVTWLVSATATYLLLDLDLALAVLLGAILVVTGPTVIVPLIQLAMSPCVPLIMTSSRALDRRSSAWLSAVKSTMRRPLRDYAVIFSGA